jgi:hypothetical protein
MPRGAAALALVNPEQLLASRFMICKQVLEVLKVLIALGLIMEHIQVAAKDQARRKRFDQPGITLNIAIALTGSAV